MSAPCTNLCPPFTECALPWPPCPPPKPCPPHPPHPPDWCGCPQPWPPGFTVPDKKWLIEHGYYLPAERVGHPVEAELKFEPNPCDPRLPRNPWPYESETRPAGTGLVMGKRDHHHSHPPIHPWPPHPC